MSAPSTTYSKKRKGWFYEKRLLSLLLCFALIFATAAPALAKDDSQIIPYMTSDVATYFEKGGLLLSVANRDPGTQIAMNTATYYGDMDHQWGYLRQNPGSYWRQHSTLQLMIGRGAICSF